MKLNDYLESMYVKANIEVQKEYSVLKQAETHAVQDLINLQRKILKWYSYTVLLVGYLLVKLGIRPVPASPKEQVQALQALANANAEPTNVVSIDTTKE